MFEITNLSFLGEYGEDSGIVNGGIANSKRNLGKKIGFFKRVSLLGVACNQQPV